LAKKSWNRKRVSIVSKARIGRPVTVKWAVEPQRDRR
jgi:hypothetical protein